MSTWAISDRVMAHLDSHLCPKCKRNMGNQSSLPCPHCGSKKRGKPKAVPVLPEIKLEFKKVQSDSRPNLMHTLSIRGGRVVWCTCESWKYRRRCKHQSNYQEGK